MVDVQGMKVQTDEIAIWWLGQGGFAFKVHSGMVFMVDPHLSFSMRKATYIHRDLCLKPEEAKVDYVLCTHDHLDHADPETLLPLSQANPAATFIGPPEAYERFVKLGIERSRCRRIVHGAETRIDGVRVKALYAEPTGKAGDVMHVGYVFDTGRVKVYITGDTKVGLPTYAGKLHDAVAERPDVMLVCINEGYSNLGPEQAADLTRMVRPRWVIPMHYDCIRENTIDPSLFTSRIAGLVGTTAAVMTYGAARTFGRGGPA